MPIEPEVLPLITQPAPATEFEEALLTGMLGVLESDTGAFPSSHIAISLIVVVSVWRQKGAIRYLFAFVFVGLFLATVYGGPHYAIDLPAGVAVGIFFLLAGARLKRALT